MSTTAAVSTRAGSAGATVSSRIVSIDVFRGIAMAVMIFVNDLDSVHGLSKWTYHMPARVDAMSYVDMVFPAFLFIVGMSLPLAVRTRLRRDPSMAKLWLHIVLRSLALLILGLILANADHGDPARMHLAASLRALLGLVGGILLWNDYGGRHSRPVTVLRWTGAVLIVIDFSVFRRAIPGGGEGWIEFSYPEILGLIAFAYFAACLLYIPTRRWRFAPLAWLAILVAYNAACTAHWMSLRHITIYEWPFDNGAHVSLVMAGVVTSLIFLDGERAMSPSRKMALGILMGILSFAAGWYLEPLGISKIRATPTWALWTVAACCVLFTALYWLCDVMKQTRWAWLVRTAGSNTLLTYLIPDVYYFLAGLTGTAWLLEHWNHGWPGVVRALAFTVAMLLVSQAVTRARLRMQL
jgi:heparan-alpha-glucosaminide N-acetyltransferase